MPICHQRITIFQEDDVTPLLGTVDGSGAVIEPTCSTDPLAARPYLLREMELAPATIDFKEGSASIGEMKVQILDKRTVPSDQSTGWFTALLSDVDGNQQLSGHRVLHEQQDANGVYYTVIDGVIGGYSLQSDYVTYDLTVRDIRDRERKMRIFTHNDKGISILPVGLSHDYGLVSSFEIFGAPVGSRYLKQQEEGLTAKYQVEPDTDGKTGIAVFTNYRLMDAMRSPYWNFYNSVLRFKRFAKPRTIDASIDTENWDFSEEANALLKDVIIQWRNSTAEPWNDVVDMPYIPSPHWHAGGYQVFMPVASITNTTNGIKAINKLKSSGIRINSDNPLTLPADGSTILVRVVLNTEPTIENPLYLEMTFGQLLKNIYDGVYSTTGTLPIRYDETIMNDLVLNTPLARIKITEPIDDARQWVEENIYKPLGMVPFLNREGKIAPIKYTLPEYDAVLTQLDDSVIVEGEWGNPHDNIVNKIEFTYYRDHLVLIDPDKPRRNSNTEFYEREVKLTFINDSVELLGEFPLDYDAIAVRAVADDTRSTNDPGEVSDEAGYWLARLRAKEMFDRFASGAQELTLSCMRSDPGVAALNPGDWVIVASTWMPNFDTGQRGINAIFQITSANDVDPLKRTFTLIEGGENLSVLAQPTIGSVTYDATRKAVDVAVTIAAGTGARVDFAVADGEPTVNSGAWSYAGRIFENGTIRIPNVPLGNTLWVRARSEAVRRRASAWTAAESIVLAGNPTIYTVEAEVRDGSDPEVRWAANADTLGVRIGYAVYGQNDNIPTALTTLGDFDAADVTKVLSSIRVEQFSKILVSVEGFAGWNGVAVTGLSGGTVHAFAERVSDSYIKPEVTIAKSQTTTQGTATVDILYDPQYRVVSMRSRSRVGRDGAWSAWTVDDVFPFEAVVDLAVGEPSTVEWEVLAVDQNGDQETISVGSTDFQGPTTVALIGDIEHISNIGGVATVRLHIANPFPDGNNVTVTYVASANIPAVNPVAGLTILGASVTDSLATTGYIDVEVTRPATGEGIGRITFFAAAVGRETYTDAFDIADISINFSGQATDLAGDTLPPNIIHSSLQDVGTLTELNVTGDVVAGGVMYASDFVLTGGSPGGGGGGGFNLASLLDVDVTGLASGSFLRYDGTVWVDANIVAADLPSHSADLLTSGTVASARISGDYLGITQLGTVTYTGLITTAASVAGTAGLRLPHGVAPTAPVDGDVWTTTAGMFVRINGVTIGPFGDGTGAGTVVGPAGATDNAVVRYDGATGTLVQNSVVTISDTGAIAGVTSITAGSFVRGGDGSAGAPTFSWGSDSNSGMYRIGENIIGFAAAGVEQWRYDINGLTIKALTMAGALTGVTTGAFSSNVTIGGTLVNTGAATFNTIVNINTSGTTIIRASNPAGGVNARAWDWRIPTNGDLEFRSIQDDGTTVVTGLRISHAGIVTVPANIAMAGALTGVTSITMSGAITGNTGVTSTGTGQFSVLRTVNTGFTATYAASASGSYVNASGATNSYRIMVNTVVRATFSPTAITFVGPLAISGALTGITDLTASSGLNAAIVALTQSGFTTHITSNASGSYVNAVGATNQLQLLVNSAQKVVITGTLATSLVDITAPDFILSSDIRLKKNIVPIHDALDSIEGLDTVIYRMKSGGRFRSGFIYQNVKEKFHVAAYEDIDGFGGVSYDQMTPLLAAGIKELLQRVKALEARNA